MMEVEAADKPTIEDLPEEVMLNIFADLYDLQKASLVCSA